MSMNGIDISHHQKTLDLNKIQFDFVVMKATQGTWMVDEKCDVFYQQAKKLGKCLGVYHYAEGGDYQKEADYFLKNVENYVGEAILVLDWESQDNKSWNKNDKTWIKNWCDYVYSKTGVKPLVYIQKSAMSKAQGIGDYGLWVAQYPDYTPTGYKETPWNEGAYSCVMRQYTSVGRLDGYSGNLDLDKFYGDKTAWNKYAGKGNTTESKPSTPTQTIPTGSTLDLVYRTMKNEFGQGETRKQKLGTRYNEVQDFINHINSASASTLANEVKAGKYGNGDVRKTVLGSKYDAVQKIINGNTTQYYKAFNNISIVNGLNSIGVDSSLANRKKIAKANGITNYSGTAAQNNKLCALAKAGKLKKA